MNKFRQVRPLILLLAASCMGLNGCKTGPPCEALASLDVPRELDKTTLPDHVIEPPDILVINGVRLVPKPPYTLEPLDAIYIRVTNTPQEDPVDGVYQVEPDGRILLGPAYGSVMAVGKTSEQIRDSIDELMKAKGLKRFQVQVAVAQSRGLQQIGGEHLVQPNGTVDLGTYGNVYVTGMTTLEARGAVEAHLAHYLLDPKVSVSVAAYNSKVYYIILDGGGLGEQVYRLPSTGNETVLDAVSQVYGLPAVASRERIWLARPSTADECDQVLPIDWKGITRGGRTATNYQVLPGDRIYVQAKPVITFDVELARILAPVERMLGITLLGNAVVEAVKPGSSTGTSR
jgi:polysaccharide export outer membrane protein